jgi:hypothetical protein
VRLSPLSLEEVSASMHREGRRVCLMLARDIRKHKENDIAAQLEPVASVSVDITEKGVQRYYVRADSDTELQAGLNLLARVCPELRALDCRAKSGGSEDQR